MPLVVKKLPASTVSESEDQLVMETKLKIIEILQVTVVCFTLRCCDVVGWVTGRASGL